MCHRVEQCAGTKYRRAPRGASGVLNCPGPDEEAVGEAIIFHA